MDFGLYEMKIVRKNPSSIKSDPCLTRTNDLSPLGSDLSEVYCICKYLIKEFLTQSTKIFLGSSIFFKDSDNTRFENSQTGNMLRQNTKTTAE